MGTGQTERMHALDGVRGVAAVVVVLYHLTLMARPRLEETAGLWEWITQSPLRPLTAGSEAVLVFFVLSGLVVSIPALSATFDWLRYYPSRLIRLYLPVIGAVLFAVALILVVPRFPGAITPDSWLDNRVASSISLGRIIEESSLLPETYTVVNVLWSLRWEVIFSVLLPVFIVVGLAVRRRPWLAAVVSVALMVAGRVLEVDALVYLPTFFLGTLMAVHLPGIRAWADRVNRRGGWFIWGALAVASVVLLVLSWLTRDIAPAGSSASAALWGLAGAGAAGLIVVAIGSPLAERMLSARLPLWLGRVSFSLYLVHVPVLASVAFLIGDAAWWLVALIAFPASFAIAWLFHVAVETPAHRLARRAGNRVASRHDRVPTPIAS
ncbi:acyltransferase family protein [Mycetocola zhujimingii]|uniref:acyltransferase family protein n=1 Tax=Mycetocola zhujimingii TaxID=2079792 RepID=UPI000D337679|nr:acyltransferase [Mycetocola zhujimingii]AWB85806.1 acyltransferase [Mycetocola zhujimingii]